MGLLYLPPSLSRSRGSLESRPLSRNLYQTFLRSVPVLVIIINSRHRTEFGRTLSVKPLKRNLEHFHYLEYAG
jgi:hypothetical protein